MTKDAFDFGSLFARFFTHWRQHLVWALVAGAVMYGATFLMPSWYRAGASILPPEETEQLPTGISVQRLLTRVPSLGGFTNLYSPSDIYRAILTSRTVNQAVVERFELMRIYRQKSMEKALREFRSHVEVNMNADGTISVLVEDRSGKRAADMANALIEELDRYNVERRNTQARRARQFLEQRVSETDLLSKSAESALRAYEEKHHIVVPKQMEMADVGPLGQLMARKTAMEINLAVIRSYLRPNHERIIQAEAELVQLKRQIGQMPQLESESARLVRDVHLYQQVYLLLSSQLEDARLRETLDTPTVTVLDDAVPPERRAKPVRRLWTIAAMGLAAFASMLWVERPEKTEAATRAARVS
ncbi:MAG TPA: GNVR domain-containing protein [Candidatus Limnocylindria bacterium]|nr:GNVR domain-containing protein [Candidatus Limnocylindria bacterium]